MLHTHIYTCTYSPAQTHTRTHTLFIGNIEIIYLTLHHWWLCIHVQDSSLVLLSCRPWVLFNWAENWQTRFSTKVIIVLKFHGVWSGNCRAMCNFPRGHFFTQDQSQTMFSIWFPRSASNIFCEVLNECWGKFDYFKFSKP